MAIRPVFSIKNSQPYYQPEDTEFTYYGGFAEIQKQKCIASLHQSYLEKHPESRLLEISTKSSNPIGVALSAFNLRVMLHSGEIVCLESAFQGSKVFENGGPYTDILQLPPWEAKKDPRLRDSGKIISFELEGISFPTEPKTFFYDWVYTNAVSQSAYAAEILQFDAFTDIEFNPQKSLNCQARSAAIYVSLSRAGRLEEALQSPDSFQAIVYQTATEPEESPIQLSFF